MCIAVSLPISPAPTTTTLRPFEVAENLARQRHRGKADRHGARTEGGLRAHALADAERRVEQAVQHRTDRPHVGGGRVGFLHLPKDLRFTDDQRVEAGGDTEQMPDGVAVRELVEVRGECRAVDAVKVGDELDELGARLIDLIGRRVELGSIAGGQHDRFAAREPRTQLAKRHVETAGVEVEPLAQLDRRGLVADSDQQQVHIRDLRI
jgi:hypothetical protein